MDDNMPLYLEPLCESASRTACVGTYPSSKGCTVYVAISGGTRVVITGQLWQTKYGTVD